MSVIVQEVGGFDAARLINANNVPLLKYHIDNEQLARFRSGQMHPADQERLIERLQLALMSSATEEAFSAERQLQLNLDPDYQIGEAMLYTPTAAEPPRRPPSSSKMLEAAKEDLMQMFGLVRGQG